MVESGVYGHVFTAAAQTYYYDVNLNDIVAVAEELGAVLRLWGTVPRAEIETALGAKYGVMEIRKACESAERGYRQEGLFSRRRPHIVPPPTSRSKRERCDENLQHLVLSVTDRCNLRCKYCLHGAQLDWVRSHGVTSMHATTALTALGYFLDRADESQPPCVSFYGGEALLELDLIEAVVAAGRRHCRGHEIIFAIDTNGLLIDSRAVDLIVREQVFVQVSLDGPGSVHDRNRVTCAGDGTFQRVIEGVERLLDREHRAADRLSFVVTMAPPVDLPGLIRFFQDFPPYVKHGIHGNPQVRVNVANLQGQDWPEADPGSPDLRTQLTVAREQYLTAVADGGRDALSPVIRELFEPDLVRFYHRSRLPLGGKFTPGGNCMPGKRKLHVTATGHYQPCERTGEVFMIGDVESGIDSERVDELRLGFHRALQDRCGNCWALRLCRVCFAVQAETASGKGAEFPLPEWRCEAVRASVEADLQTAARVLAMPVGCRSFLVDTMLA